MFRIKEIRKAKDMTQEQLSSLVGVSRPQITRYENGSRIPPSDTLVKIAEALNVSLDELVIHSAS